MTLQFAPDAPWILHAFAAALLFAHIAGGAVGIASGAIAIVAPRGRPLHRAAGQVFFVAMLCMAGVGAAVSPFLEDKLINTTAGVFTLYLVATGWATVRRRAGESGSFERFAFALAAGLASMALLLAVTGLGAPIVYVFGVLAAIGAAGDLRLLRRGGLAGPSRIARHLWRMGLALAVAAGSFFLGQQDHLPAVVRGTFLPAIPPLAALGLTLFWLTRMGLAQRPRPARATSA